MKRLRQDNPNTEAYWREHWSNTPPWKIGEDVLTDRWEAMAAYIKPGDLVLDVGGGRGEIAEWIRARTGCGILVADISQSGVDACHARGIPAVRCDWKNLAQHVLPIWDVVMAAELLEHVDEPPELMRLLAGTCKRGGRIILSTPLGDAYAHDPVHVWTFLPADVQSLLAPYGETEVTTVGDWCIVGRCRLRIGDAED